LFCYYKWSDAGIFVINDLLDEFLSFNRLQEIYGIEPTFLQYTGILHMILQIGRLELNLQNKAQ